MKVKIKDGGIYRTVEINSADYGIYLEKGYTKVVEETKPTPVIEETVEPVIEELPKAKKKKK